GGGDVEALFLGDVGGVEAAGDVVGAEAVPPLGVGRAVGEGDGDGGAAVTALDAGDPVVVVGAGPAALAVPGLLGGAEFPGDLEVGGGDGGAVVPDRLGPDGELVGERVLVDDPRLLGEQVQVGGEGGSVGLPVPGVRQGAVEHLEGVDAAALRGQGRPGPRQGVDDPGDVAAVGPLPAVAGVGVLRAVGEAVGRASAALLRGAGGENEKRRGQRRGEHGGSAGVVHGPLPLAVRIRGYESRKTEQSGSNDTITLNNRIVFPTLCDPAAISAPPSRHHRTIVVDGHMV